MMRKWGIWLILFLPSISIAQSPDFQRYQDIVEKPRLESNFRIGFYNLENLFDLEDDSLTRDEAFTPEGKNRYTFDRYKKKSNGIARTILALGGWEPMELLGLCEVESKWVLDGLVQFSPLKNAGYEIIHRDSPDRRGIDIACLYRPERFNVILYKYFRVKFPHDPERTTRDMLYVKGILPNQDTLHYFINHWPSRYGGQFVSEENRKYVASLLRQKVDSLEAKFASPKIVICGDLNDEPSDISVLEVLDAKDPYAENASGLLNFMLPIQYHFGTHSFAGEWGVLDQFIVSSNFLYSSRTSTTPGSVGIFDAPWLLTKNAAGEDVPFRTFQGPAYKGGYSDHLPIILDLYLETKNAPE